jgi:hypothetical protein
MPLAVFIETLAKNYKSARIFFPCRIAAGPIAALIF